jgi:hypothetical protein
MISLAGDMNLQSSRKILPPSWRKLSPSWIRPTDGCQHLPTKTVAILTDERQHLSTETAANLDFGGWQQMIATPWTKTRLTPIDFHCTHLHKADSSTFYVRVFVRVLDTCNNLHLSVCMWRGMIFGVIWLCACSCLYFFSLQSCST